tara:strand:+ start:429 stop:1034 length:606 start_codon:yes stop_codon:yes gene_type:complete
MLYRVIFLLVLINCAGPGKNIILRNSQKSYVELNELYKACKGKGKIDSFGKIKGKLSFSFMSQRDSTFIVFNDIIGRKALLLWVTPNIITARDLIKNKQYDYDQIKYIFPIMHTIQPNDLTRLVWGIQPESGVSQKRSELRKKNKSKINYMRDKLADEKRSLVGAKFYNKESNQGVNIEITSRDMQSEQINMKKVWKLLEY